LAALFHDVGHAPLSHSTESFMPPVSALALGEWQDGPGDRLASHEDYTLKIITGSSLTRLIEERFRDQDVTPEDIAALVANKSVSADRKERFVVNGKDYFPIMRQCVSSELDADRMDYLLRDSYFAGVPYGRYDHDWLVENLRPVDRDDSIYLGLDARASFAFEDYLLSRYHMFMSVYFHHIPIGYEVMLRAFFRDQPDELEIPTNVDRYLELDDVSLLSIIRRSKNQWARRIVERRAYRMLVEVKQLVAPDSAEHGASMDVEEASDALKRAGIDAIVHSVKGQLSKYYGAREGAGSPDHGSLPLYIVEDEASIPVEVYTPLYQRYSGAIHLKRVYVEPASWQRAKDVLRSMRA
jgi:HD superfamily phosphohydrolase